MHAWPAPALPALVALHVLAAFAFALVHGPAVFVAWALPRERDPARMASLLDLSQRSTAPMWTTYVVLGLTGSVLALAQHAWRAPWAWGSALVLVVLTLAMSWLGAQPFNHARGALGLRWFDGKGVQPATGHVDHAALEQARAIIAARAPALMATGVLGLAALVWLMVARPG